MPTMRPLLVALALASPVLIGPAAADVAAADPQAAAKTHAEKARRLYDLRRYAEAIPEFESAYELSGDPAYIYNIAQANRLANRLPEAIQHYELYLQKVPDAPNRADIERRIAELQATARPPNGLDPTPPPSPPASPPAFAPMDRSWDASPPPGADDLPTVRYTVSRREPDRRHDDLYLRVQLGFGVMAFGVDEEGTPASEQETATGGAGLFTLAVGGAVSDRIVLFGELAITAMSNPTLERGGSSRPLEAEVSLGGFGLGLSYYLLPRNFFFSGSLRLVQLTQIAGGETVKTKWGPGLALGAGQEWWISPAVALGFALQLQAAAMTDDRDEDATWTTASLGLVFSATYD